jgi:hypothetical protein
LFAVPVRWVLVRDPAGEFKTQALLCTDLEADPQKILFLVCYAHWQLEVSFQEMRRHLGFETQRQWSGDGDPKDHTSALGVVLAAHFVRPSANGVQAAGAFRQAAWYHKAHPTFADALALVRKELWAQEQTFCVSPSATDTIKVPRAFVERLTDAVCYAA